MMRSGGNFTMSVFFVTLPVLLQISHLNSSIFSSFKYNSMHSLKLVLQKYQCYLQAVSLDWHWHLFEFSGRGRVRLVNSR